MNRTAVALAFAALAACSSRSTGDFVPTADGGNTPADVVSGGSDAGTPRPDSGTPRPDSGTPRPDSGTPTADAGGINFGRCGRSVVSQLCMCGMDQNCAQGAIGGSQTCLTCIVGAQQTCCPTEFAAVQQCVNDRMCMDQNCVMTMCATQINAANRCLSTTVPAALMSGTGACYEAQVRCLGDVATDTSVCGEL